MQGCSSVALSVDFSPALISVKPKLVTSHVNGKVGAYIWIQQLWLLLIISDPAKDIILLTKGLIVSTVVFPVVMYKCESWTIKKTEHQRTDAFTLGFWRRLLRVPWIVSRSSQSILKEINPEYSIRADDEAESPILWPPDAKNWLIGKDPDAGKDLRARG